MRRQIAREKETALQKIAEERANRERLEALKKEVESKTTSLPIKPVTLPPRQQHAPKPVVNQNQAANAANFDAQSELDKEVLEIYGSRQALPNKLPPVKFSKIEDGVYLLGSRKITVEILEGSVYVKLGTNREDFLSWLEKIEKVEALRIRSFNSANTFCSLQLATQTVF
eukprot:TRINITY_DN7757_c0_g3_i2.p1 TRINITY_DN7757_c0_g3~~TRINITY_DN7757_c0_g3_i2.p1  ORF type:complete len:170 (+),score=37.87 TRINITY_DN7757_c0_g3_i2:156-665(+)